MTSELGVYHVASVCHDAHRRLCINTMDEVPPVWEDLAPYARANALDNVRIQRDNPEYSPADRHEHWVSLRKAQGWTYATKKDPEAKTHPCLVPFLALPESQQMKGVLFGMICKALLPNVR